MAGEEVAAGALADMPLGNHPHQAAVVAALIRDTYAPLLASPAADFARACADGAEAVHPLFEVAGQDVAHTRELAEALGIAFGKLVENRLAAAG